MPPTPRKYPTLLFSLLIWGYFNTAVLADEPVAERFVKAAIALENPAVEYDSAYRVLKYPMGDVPADKGVCADVIVRAYRAIGIDLQERVHDDMEKHFSAYPALWGLKRPDTNIDHRRVPNLRVFFKHKGRELAITDKPGDYKPGDIVTWNLRKSGSLPHIGIVTNRYSADRQRPLIMHNIGSGQVLEDLLFAYTITGHYRYGLD